jgi:hypothetical protein
MGRLGLAERDEAASAWLSGLRNISNAGRRDGGNHHGRLEWYVVNLQGFDGQPRLIFDNPSIPEQGTKILGSTLSVPLANRDGAGNCEALLLRSIFTQLRTRVQNAIKSLADKVALIKRMNSNSNKAARR